MKLNYSFKNQALLEQALTHTSFSKEGCYERLEFLGDAVLDAVVAQLLYEIYPDAREGFMTQVRSNLVNEKFLSELSIKLELFKHIKVDKGGEQDNVYMRDSVLADVFESVVGAIFTDGGYEAANQFVRELFEEKVKNPPQEIDYKSKLMCVTQQKYKVCPTYELVKTIPHGSSPTFVVDCKLGKRTIGTGTGNNKKSAEKAAAQDALVAMEIGT